MFYQREKTPDSIIKLPKVTETKINKTVSEMIKSEKKTDIKFQDPTMRRLACKKIKYTK